MATPIYEIYNLFLNQIDDNILACLADEVVEDMLYTYLLGSITEFNTCIKEIKIEGILGESTIKIEDGFVFFENSPCPNKLCVNSSAISKNGDWIACLPNGVFARIEGEDENSEIDGTSY